MDDIGESASGQGFGDEVHAGAMNRGVDDLDVFLSADDGGGEGKRSDPADVLVVNVLTDGMDEVRFTPEVDVGNPDGVDFFDDEGVVRRDDLSAIVPINFETVVFLGVVGGGDDDPSLTFQVPNGKGYFGSRSEFVKEVNFYPVGGEDVGGGLGEKRGVVTAVVSDDYADGGELPELPFEIIGETLCGGGDGIDVHPVGTDAHDTPEATGTELKIAVKSVDEFGGVRVVKHSLHGGTGIGVISIGKPLMGFSVYSTQKFSVHRLSNKRLAYISRLQ